MNEYQLSQPGDIHITFKDGLFLIWKFTKIATPGTWLPIEDTRDQAYVSDYLEKNHLMKIKETRDASDLEPMPLCGIYRVK